MVTLRNHQFSLKWWQYTCNSLPVRHVYCHYFGENCWSHNGTMRLSDIHMHGLPLGPVCSLKAKPRYGISFVSSRLDPFSTFLIVIAICNIVRHLGCNILRRETWTMHGYSLYIMESALLALVREIHWLIEYPHRGSRIQKVFISWSHHVLVRDCQSEVQYKGSQYLW